LSSKASEGLLQAAAIVYSSQISFTSLGERLVIVKSFFSCIWQFAERSRKYRRIAP
jgi:hypothetical protein